MGCRQPAPIHAGHGPLAFRFSLLTANQEILANPQLVAIARSHGRTIAQIVFRFAIDVGMVPLTGTTDANHMRLDLDVLVEGG